MERPLRDDDRFSTAPLTVNEWDPVHPRWPELLQLITEMDQTEWFTYTEAWHQSTHMLVALQAQSIMGFLRFVIQDIGADIDHHVVTFGDRPLREAKVAAFGVPPTVRRHGVGRALQQAALDRARDLGCYQMRSHSSGANTANHQLKLAMGFGVDPIIRGDDRGGVYFVMPLHHKA